jgi:hypothetical protein
LRQNLNIDFLPLAIGGSQCDQIGIIFDLWVIVGGGGWGGDQRPLLPLLLGPPFYQILLFLSTTLLTGMTGISLHMQWLQNHWVIV